MNNENHSHTGSDNPENVIDEEYRDDDEAYYDDSETLYYDVSFDDDNVEAVYSYIDNETGEYREFRGTQEQADDFFRHYYQTDDLIDELIDLSDKNSDDKTTKEYTVSRELKNIASKFNTLRAVLLKKINGQDNAINTFCRNLFTEEMIARADRTRRKPKGIYLFTGAPGVGKTYLAETAAEHLNIPCMRFDMTEFSGRDSHSKLIGFEYTWKDSTSGILTDFVYNNPQCIIIFDEIEKAHKNVLHILYQILDAGILTDSYYSTKSTDNKLSGEELAEAVRRSKVYFRNAIIIFTSNLGRSLYEGKYRDNCAGISRKTLLNALRTERNPETGEFFFPDALVSRLATGCPLIFNNLKVYDLIGIMQAEIQKITEPIEEEYNIKIDVDDDVLLALLFSEGGKIDARSAKSLLRPFILSEIFKAIGKTNSDNVGTYHFKVDKSNLQDNVAELFCNKEPTRILVQGDYQSQKDYHHILSSFNAEFVYTPEDAIKYICENNVDMVMLDVSDDNIAASHNTLKKLRTTMPELPVYLIAAKGELLDNDGVDELLLGGARCLIDIPVSASKKEFDEFEKSISDIAAQLYMHKQASKIASRNKVLNFEIRIDISETKTEAVVSMTELSLKLALNADDIADIVSDVERPELRFDDIIGVNRAKQELKYFVDYLKNPVRFAAKGVKPPKGVLLYGPPGTGKTMMAKALAGESDVTFISCSASEIVQNKGVNGIKSIFEKARRYAPSVIFIDEVDSIGRRRTGSVISAHTESILNALLAEMDGFSTNIGQPVLVLAATNYGIEEGDGGIGVLDEAFVRRFDAKIRIELPDKSERKALLYMLLDKLNQKGIEHDITEKDIESIAERTSGMSPAILSNIFYSALKKSINSRLDGEMLDEALEEETLGEAKDIDYKYLESTACHECGHALIYCLSGKTPSYLTIVSRGGVGGYMQYSDNDLNTPYYTKDDLIWRIRTALGGRASEIVRYGNNNGINTGASGDLRKATLIAQRMVTVYGMDEKLGMAVWDNNAAADSAELRLRVNEILSEELNNTIDLINQHLIEFQKLTESLIKSRRITGEEIREILGLPQD